MFHLAKRVIVLLSSALLGASCSGAAILDVVIPRDGYTLYNDIAYGKAARHHLDIYVPANLEKPAPVLVFFYGGSWKKGSKDDYRFVGQAFASKGYVTVIADYRIYPEAYFPDFLHDTAQAFVWVHQHIKDYHGDANKLFLAGHSAGAYNAVMLSVNKSYLNAAGGQQSWIKGTIGIAGPYDFLPFTDPDIIGVFSKEKDTLTQPVTFVKEHMPPMLLLTGDKDEDVLPRNSIRLSAKLKAFHNEVALKTYPDVAHIGIVLALAHGFRGKAPVLEDIDRFVQEMIKRSS